MTTSLGPTLGARLVVFFLATILYGIGILQCCLYFHWYTRDSWRIKSTVLLLLFIETFQIVAVFVAIYNQVVNNFGNLQTLITVLPLDVVQVLSIYLSALIVQLYFAHTLYAFDRHNIYRSVSIALLALLAFAIGAGQSIASYYFTNYSFLPRGKITGCIQIVATVLCDVAITVALCTVFSVRKSGIRSTDSILNTLTLYAVGRGALTAFAAALNLILLLAIPGTFYFLLGLVLSCKLYMNSMLFSLNSRQHVRNQADNEPNSISINLSSLAAAEPVQNGTNGRLKISAPLSESTAEASDWEEVNQKARFRRQSQPSISP